MLIALSACVRARDKNEHLQWTYKQICNINTTLIVYT